MLLPGRRSLLGKLGQEAGSEVAKLSNHFCSLTDCKIVHVVQGMDTRKVDECVLFVNVDSHITVSSFPVLTDAFCRRFSVQFGSRRVRGERLARGWQGRRR